MSETIMLSMIGVPIGLLIGIWTISHMNTVGIDLTNWSDGLKQFGMAKIVRPEIDMGSLLWIGASVALTAILAAIYPSIKAMNLRPVEAMRKI